MSEFIQFILVALSGLALAVYGFFHGIARYPGTDAFARLSSMMPTLLAVLSFALCIVAALTGVVMLIAAARCLRRRPKRTSPPQHPSLPPHVDSGWRGSYGDFDPDP
jgi:ABC-type uncharacterized transport system permease subunit